MRRSTSRTNNPKAHTPIAQTGTTRREESKVAQSREYTIVTESKYIREYQNEHYRAVIMDGRSQPIRTGRSWSAGISVSRPPCMLWHAGSKTAGRTRRCWNETPFCTPS